MPATMLVHTTEGLRDARTRVLVSESAKDVIAHARKGGLTAGFSISFEVHPTKNLVVQIMKSGHLTQKDIKPLLAEGFTEWHYSWAFSGSKFRTEDGTIVDVIKVEKLDPLHLSQWLRAFGG